MAGYSRRRVLAVGATALSTGPLAGCVGRSVDEAPSGASTESRRASVRASFFVFGDFATRVAGDVAVAETLVPIGQHGHGWEPGPKVREAILEADLFVYGMRGFQPWVDDVVRDLRADEHDVQVVAAGHDIDLLGPRDAGDEHEEPKQGEDEYDHSSVDPHFWLDPLRAKQAVANVTDGFVEVDPGNQDTYEANATAYRDRLVDLHETIDTTLADRVRDVVLVAGHDAFQYLHDRYGVEVEALTGLAPDDHPSPRDVERAQQLIEEHDLEYLCADPLESQQAAEQLVAETTAREVLPLTALPGRIQAWQDDGWGYVDVMERLNLPTLERALDAS